MVHNLGSDHFEKAIPFIVIETSKTELRVIRRFRKHEKACYRKLAEQLQVFTSGNEKCSPLRSNPLEVPSGVDRQVHIVRQKECFAAFMPVFPALPGILSEAMELSYEDHPDPHSPPTIADLYRDCVKVLSEKSYCGEVSSNIKGALDVRLGELTRLIAGDVFKCRLSTPSIPHLMSSYSLIEMDRLPQDQKCLETLTLLSSLWEHVQCLPPADGLRLVVLIEECHNIFGQTGEARPSEDAPNPMAYVVALLNRLLMELRARGAGIILADQHPSNLDPSAVKSTCTKIAGEEIHGDDRDALAVSMLLPGFQAEDLARLKPGQMYFFKEGFYRPIRIRTEDLRKELDLTKFPTDEELRQNISGERWFQDLAAMRVSTELDQLKEYMDQLDDCKGRVAVKVTKLLEAYEFLRGEGGNRLNRQRFAAMAGILRALRRELVSSYNEFRRGPYRLFSYLITGGTDIQQSDLRALAESLNRRFESVIESGTHGLIGVIDRLIKNCRRRLKEINHEK